MKSFSAKFLSSILLTFTLLAGMSCSTLVDRHPDAVKQSSEEEVNSKRSFMDVNPDLYRLERSRRR
jgi:hypothetical protein